jgi:hypothetical protein
MDITPSFPSRDYLASLSVEHLRTVDIKTKDEEDIVQEIIDSKLATMPVQNPVKPEELKIPDIKTKEEEDFWQKKVDARNARIKARVLRGIKKKPEKKIEKKEVKKSTKPVCKVCKKSFKNEVGLRLHRGKFHPTKK